MIDPFGGVALGAADALANGLNFVGVELEQSFVDMGAGCDCTGISKADWVRCFGRWKRFTYKDGRHWCPRCLAEAGLVLEDWEPALPGMEALTVSYKRNSGKIPYTKPHYYTGNLDLFVKHAKGGATAVLVQGDSRQLVEVLEGARAEGLISSPPYAASIQGSGADTVRKRIAEGRYKGLRPDVWTSKGNIAGSTYGDGYSTDPSNLGNMPTGEPPRAIIASPPYTTQTVHDRCGIDPDKLIGNPPGPHSQVFTMADYGDSDGQLGTMPTGEPPSAVISSPPLGKAQSGGTSFWEGLEEKHDRKFSDKVREGSQGYREDQLGDSEGQLGAMSTGELPQAVISSPPFADSQQSTDADFMLDSTKINPTLRKLADQSYFPAKMEGDGQLAALLEGEPPQVDGLISSPPFASTLGKGGETKGFHSYDKDEAYNRCKRDYVVPDAEGQLGQMKEGEPPKVDGLVSSPPHEGSMDSGDENAERRAERTDGFRQGMTTFRYGQNPYTFLSKDPSGLSNEQRHELAAQNPQIGALKQDTFWSAAKTILLQCHQVLAPGGVAIWVVKDFVRNKKRVDFTGQWQTLCESCGFEMIEIIKAWLVEERGTQYDLEGKAHTKQIARKSFFRRLYEFKARAAKFWLSISRPEQAAHLWRAHNRLWHEYNKKMGSPKPSNVRPTHVRITSAAQVIAYRAAGEPDIETDTQIDYEIVLVTRKV